MAGITRIPTFGLSQRWWGVAAGTIAGLMLMLGPPSAEAKYVLVERWGGAGSAPGSFNFSEDVTAGDLTGGLAVYPNGDVLVADTFNNRIQRFTPAGALMETWGHLGAAPGEFDTPRDLAFDASGSLYVTDDGNDRIQKLTGEGEFVTHFTDPRWILAPVGVAPDLAGNVFVTTRDVSGPAVRQFTSDGEFVRWLGPADHSFVSPSGIVADGAGRLYVTVGDRAERFDGEFWTIWESDLWDPSGIALGPTGRLYIADNSHRILIYQITASGFKFIGDWVTKGAIGDVAVDPTGSFVYASIRDTNQVHKYALVHVVKLTAHPKRRTGRRSATFKFRSDEPGTAFECKLDRGQWRPCESPHRVDGLARGGHRLSVRAAGTDGKAAKWRWTVG